MTSTTMLERIEFQIPPLRKLLLVISLTFAPLCILLPQDDGLITLSLTTPSVRNVEHHEANIRVLNSQEIFKLDGTWFQGNV